jgi:uncharacterized membrane protein SpoIIM required for sporulation
MNAPSLKSQRFRAEREADWRRLEELLRHLESGRRRALSDDDVIALPVLYRGTLSSLSVARAISLDRNLLAYLESLSTRAYFFVYGSRAGVGERMAAFFRRDWPDAVRGLWRETLAAGGLGVLGTFTAYLLTMRDPAWYFAFVPGGLAGARNPRASTAELAKTLVSGQHDNLGFFAGFLFTHNAQIALFAFALGFACCLPTAFLMLFNGLMLGAFLALFVSHGLGAAAGGWLMIHGVTELFAVTLAGAAGFHLGWTLSFPGQRTRQTAMVDAGRTAATAMAGVVLMLAVAGLLEGFARQLVINTAARYGVGLASALVWGVYFYRRRRIP